MVSSTLTSMVVVLALHEIFCWFPNFLKGKIMAVETTLATLSVGQCKRYNLAAGVSTPSTIVGPLNSRLVVAVEKDTYFRMVQNSSPSDCTSDGTDQLLLAGNQYRIEAIPTGYKLVYLCPQGGWLHEQPGA